MFATSDQLGLAKLVITTARARRTAVFLPRSRIRNLSFRFVGCPGQITAIVVLISYVVTTFNTRPPSEEREEHTIDFELRIVQVDKNKYLCLQQYAVQRKGNQWALQKHSLVKVLVNGAPASRATRVLLDTVSKSLRDFMFLMLADPDQLAVRCELLASSVSQQPVVLGSQPIVDEISIMRLKYQRIKEELTFDTGNINHNSILNTPRLYQCQSVTALESYPAQLVQVGSDKAQLSRSATKIMLMVALIEDQRAEGLDARDELSRHVERSCRDVDKMGLPCVQAINCVVFLSMDESKAHRQRKFIKKTLWDQYCQIPYICQCFVPVYLVGRKEGGCTSKTSKTHKTAVTSTPKLGTIANLREWNKDAHNLNLIVPSPDAAGMLKRTAAGQLHATLYARSAFE